jgi:hypothetical protein
MENIFVEFLPPWVETGLQPAFYDKESGTVLQQTARMYARVNMLIRMFNKLSKNTKTEVERFEEAVNTRVTNFENSVNETVDNYIEQFNQLHDYVQDYFDNLDVQEEINNKLDDMAEAGTLTDIIAQYLTLAGVLAFSTVSDLASAENLAVGSKAKTYGYKRQGDGVYDLYTVREILNTDVVDGYNIVALTNTNDLIAERMQGGKKAVAKIKATDNLQDYLNLKIDKTIVLEEDYTASAKVFINSDTTLDLNNHTLTCDYDPSETIIFCYGLTDTFTGYNGYKNIIIRNGTISGGDIAMMHNKNVVIENVEFINVNSRHAMQIAGSYNITVRNCIFNGTSPVNVDGSEAINIDPCNHGGQPWMDENSVMYDHTPNKGIIIENNTFKAGINGSRHTTAIGSHGYDDTKTNIYCYDLIIRNNDLGSPYTSFINTCVWNNTLIENNIGTFATSGTNTATYGIKMRGGVNGMTIKGNRFKNSMYFVYSGEDVEFVKNNLNILDNIVSTLDTATYRALTLCAIKDSVIKGNTVDYKQTAVYLNATQSNGSIVETCENVKIVDNIFNKTDSTSNQAIRVTQGTNIEILKNSFPYTGLTSPAGYAIAISSGLSNIRICDNTTRFIKHFISNNSFQNDVFINNNTTLVPITSNYSYSDLTGSGTFTIPLTYFSGLVCQLGETFNTEYVELKPWLTDSNDIKFTTSDRAFKIPVSKDDGTFGVITLTITDNATKYSFTGDIAIRQIYGKC